MKARKKQKQLLVLIVAFGIVCQCISGCAVASSEAVDIPTALGDLAYSKQKTSGQYTVYLQEKEVLVPYYVITNNYVDNGTCLVLRKNVIENMSIYNHNAVMAGYYENSVIDQMLNGSFLERFTADFVNLIEEVNITITAKESLHGGEAKVTELQRKVFLLSATEVGHSGGRTILREGKALDYFDCEERRIAYTEDGEQVSWWLRTPNTWYDNVVCGVDANGTIGIGGVGSYGENNYANGVRPAFCLAADIPVCWSTEGYYCIG